MRLGNDKFGGPGNPNYGGNKWYCARSMNIPGTDGQCGPSGGNQCPLVHAFPEGSGGHDGEDSSTGEGSAATSQARPAAPGA